MSETTCVSCEGRGWNLRDARIDVCACGAFDPPKWVTRGDTACIIPHHTDVDRPRRAAHGYACAGHHAHLEQMLAELPAIYDDLSLMLRRSGTNFAGHSTDTVTVNKRTGEEESSAWIDARAAEIRQEVRNECVRMAREVAEGNPDDELPATDDVPSIARWLQARLSWICEQPDVDDTHRYLDALTRDCKRVAYPSGRRRIEVGPCGGEDCPGTLWLVGDTDEARTMSCDFCKRVVESRYWRRERKRIDGVDVNPWLTLTEAAAHVGTSTRTVERWVQKGRLKARGTPMRVKASAVEALVLLGKDCA